MNISQYNFNFNKKELVSLIGMLILLIGIPIGVYLVQNQQIFKGRAYQDEVFEAFEFKDGNGNVITCDSSTNPPSCTTQTPDISITIKNLDALIPK